LLILDNYGAVIDHVNVGERLVGGLVGTYEGIVVIMNSGKVICWVSFFLFKIVGTFKGLVCEGVVLLDVEIVVVVVNVERLVILNFCIGVTSIRLNLFGLEGSFIVGLKKVVYVVSMFGVLVGTFDDG